MKEDWRTDPAHNAGERGVFVRLPTFDLQLAAQTQTLFCTQLSTTTYQLYAHYLDQKNHKMSPSSKVLVYHHRHDVLKPIVPDGLAVMTVPELEGILQKHSNLQRTSKPIARGSLSVEIYECDLMTESQKPQWAGMPNYESNVAGVTVPWKVALGRLVGSKDFDDLVILSAKR